MTVLMFRTKKFIQLEINIMRKTIQFLVKTLAFTYYNARFSTWKSHVRLNILRKQHTHLV